MELSLTVDEADALRLLLDEALGDLSFEIADTENPDYRARLRDRRIGGLVDPVCGREGARLATRSAGSVPSRRAP